MGIHPQNREKAKRILYLVFSEAGDKETWENEEPGVIDLIYKKIGLKLNRQAIGKLLNELCEAKYLEKVFGGRTGRKVVALNILLREWREGGAPKSSPEKTEKKKKTAEKPKPESVQKPREPAKPRFVLLADFSNIENVLASSQKAVEAIVSLERSLSDLGTIEAKFTFVPFHRLNEASALSALHRHLLVACPRHLRNGAEMGKDKDLVDARMSNLSNIISLFGDVSHIAFVTGDGDFVDAISFAHDHGKKVLVAAPTGHLSRALERTADELIFM